MQLSPIPEAEAREELTTVLTGLLVDHARRAEVGARAKKLVNQNRGATQRTVDWLEPLLLSSPAAVNRVSSIRVQNASTL